MVFKDITNVIGIMDYTLGCDLLLGALGYNQEVARGVVQCHGSVVVDVAREAGVSVVGDCLACNLHDDQVGKMVGKDGANFASPAKVVGCQDLAEGEVGGEGAHLKCRIPGGV